MDENCIFCKIIAGQIPSNKVYEDDRAFAFRDINPQAPVHILIVPKHHIPRIADLTTDAAPLMGEVMLVAANIAKAEGIGEGFRLVVNNGERAGQSVFHIHFHLLGGRDLRWPPG